MIKLILTLVLSSVVYFNGCTPTAGNIARKTVQEGEKAEIGMMNEGFDLSIPSLVDPPTARIIRNYGPAIKLYSERYGFDWRFILAVMKQESRFAHKAESHMGALGLMQIMPVTGEEVARKLSLADLSHPESNIRGGVFYLRTLYEKFDGANESDRLKLTLAAYNAGLSRVYDAQDVATYFKEEPTDWQAVRDALSLLSKRYYTLHRNVWQQDRPKSGWFGNSKETLKYVDSVLGYYDEYRSVLN